jgi:hypothetical protein
MQMIIKLFCCGRRLAITLGADDYKCYTFFSIFEGVMIECGKRNLVLFVFKTSLMTF